MSDKPKFVCIDPKVMREGPIRHEFLPGELLARIAALHEVLADVIPLSLRDWIDGFMRDRDPEGEILLWEALAAIYTAACEGVDYSLEQRREVMQLVIHRYMRSERKTLREFELRTLSRDQAKSVMQYFRMKSMRQEAWENALGQCLAMIRRFFFGA